LCCRGCFSCRCPGTHPVPYQECRRYDNRPADAEADPSRLCARGAVASKRRSAAPAHWWWLPVPPNSIPIFSLGSLHRQWSSVACRVTDRQGDSGVDTGVWWDGSWIGRTSTASSWWLCPPLHSIGSRNRSPITKFLGWVASRYGDHHALPLNLVLAGGRVPNFPSGGCDEPTTGQRRVTSGGDGCASGATMLRM
jgi:hypothetical protein